MVLQLDSSLSGVIQGALVLSTLGVQAWFKRWDLFGVQKGYGEVEAVK
jgi:hypothetical protein